LHYWHVSRFRPFEDLPDVSAGLGVHPADVFAERHDAGISSGPGVARPQGKGSG
jgi:hypothetical protein